jgi:tetratricopeptide (TPR) repeat protein
MQKYIEKDVLKTVDTGVLPTFISKELKPLGEGNREIVSKYLILADKNIDVNDSKALFWAEKAVKRAGRIAYVRQFYGALLYNNGKYKNAIRELETANRLSKKSDLIYMIADSYRGIGNSQKGLEILNSFSSNAYNRLSIDEKIEFAIVYAAIRVDVGQKDYAKMILNKALKLAENNLDIEQRILDATDNLLKV